MLVVVILSGIFGICFGPRGRPPTGTLSPVSVALLSFAVGRNLSRTSWMGIWAGVCVYWGYIEVKWA